MFERFTQKLEIFYFLNINHLFNFKYILDNYLNYTISEVYTIKICPVFRLSSEKERRR